MLALRCIAPFSKDYSLALKVHNTLLLRLLLSLQVASNSGTRALPPYFEICSFTCYIALGVNGLPIRGYWQTVYIYRERSANNLLLADHNGLPITPIDGQKHLLVSAVAYIKLL